MKEYQFEFWKPRWAIWIVVLINLILFAIGIILMIAIPVFTSVAFHLSKTTSTIVAAFFSFGFFYYLGIFSPRQKRNRLAELTMRNEILTFEIATSGLVIKERNETILWSEFKSYRSDLNSILFDLLVLKLNGGKRYKFILQRFYAKQSHWIEFKEVLIRMIKENNPDAKRGYWENLG